MSSKKTHITCSAAPLAESENHIALCGEQVPNVVFVLRWIAGELQTKEFNTLLFCHKCVAKLSLEGLKEKSYVYGIRDRATLRAEQLEGMEESA